MKCDRCNEEMSYFCVSYMNTDNICEQCVEKEKDHPRYQEAKAAELAEVKKGNTTYPGLFGGQKWPFGSSPSEMDEKRGAF